MRSWIAQSDSFKCPNCSKTFQRSSIDENPDAWAADQGIEGSMITFLGDPNSTLTKELDMVLDHEGVVDVLGPGRCKRFAAIIDGGEIKSLFVSEAPDDPAGDARPEVSCIENMLKLIAAC